MSPLQGVSVTESFERVSFTPSPCPFPKVYVYVTPQAREGEFCLQLNGLDSEKSLPLIHWGEI